MKTVLLPKQNDQDVILHKEKWSEDEFKSIIRSLNIKVTWQRLLILKALTQGRPHVSAQELYEKSVKLDERIGFATVYRFLKELAQGNIVNEVRVGHQPARYELMSPSHHDHLTCERCGKICEFENKTIEQLQEKIAQHFGYKLTHHVLELYGLCHACQDN